MDQQQNADHRPENIAALADDRQGYASRFGELKYRGDFSGACLVNAHAQRNEFEHDVNAPIHRLENKSGQERRGQRRADETQGDVNLQHARQMETRFEQKDRKKSRAAAAIESIDAVFQGSPVFYPTLRQSPPVQKPEDAANEPVLPAHEKIEQRNQEWNCNQRNLTGDSQRLRQIKAEQQRRHAGKDGNENRERIENIFDGDRS